MRRYLGEEDDDDNKDGEVGTFDPDDVDDKMVVVAREYRV